MMDTFEFSIVGSGLDHTAEDFESRFYDGKCSDALVSFQRGKIIIDFARRASSAREAIESAVADVSELGCCVERIEPDPLVSLSDIASRTNLSRAAVSLYASGKRGENFPPPTAKVTSDSPLWEWFDIAKWLRTREQISETEFQRACVISEVNARIHVMYVLRQSHYLIPSIFSELSGVLASSLATTEMHEFQVRLSTNYVHHPDAPDHVLPAVIAASAR